MRINTYSETIRNINPIIPTAQMIRICNCPAVMPHAPQWHNRAVEMILQDAKDDKDSDDTDVAKIHVSVTKVLP